MPKVKFLPKWLIYSLFSVLWWGIFGFLGKVGSDKISPTQMQVFLTIGMVPVAIVCVFRLKFQIATSKPGVSYSVLMGIFAALGTLAFFGAMKSGKASLVAPVTSLYPAVTVLLALVVLKERLNKVQTLGLILALASIVILSM